MKRICSAFMCPNTAVPGKSYCTDHASYGPKKEFNTKQTVKPWGVLYDTQWKKFAKQFITDHPQCSWPGCTATTDLVCDHYVYTARDMWLNFGKFIYDPSLYRTLCRKHNLIHFNQREHPNRRRAE